MPRPRQRLPAVRGLRSPRRLAKNADHAEPAALAKFGAGGAKVYQLRKARGASIETVDLMVGTPDFAAAAQLYNGVYAKQAAEAKRNPAANPSGSR